MQKCHVALIALWCIGTMCFTGGCAMGVRPVPQTDGARASASFNFTLSPDDRWLVYFERIPRERIPEYPGALSWLRVLDLETGRRHDWTLERADQPGLSTAATWDEESQFCILSTTVLIDVRDPDDVIFATGQTARSAQDKRKFVYNDQEIQIPVPARLTCSDCPDEEVPREHIREHVPEEHQPTMRHPAAASRDGRFIFYQRLEEVNEVERITIVMRNVETGEERELATHRAKPLRLMFRVSAERFTTSPDGRWLAYRVLASANMGSDRGRLHLVNLETGRHRKITGPVFYDMRWTSDSSRLYFYDGERLNYINVR